MLTAIVARWDVLDCIYVAVFRKKGRKFKPKERPTMHASTSASHHLIVSGVANSNVPVDTIAQVQRTDFINI